jgi:hypothetical protein
MASDAQLAAWRDAIAARHKTQRRQRARPAPPPVVGVRVPAPDWQEGYRERLAALRAQGAIHVEGETEVSDG